MTLTFSIYWIPIVLTIVMLAIMFRPYHDCGRFDFGAINRIFWIIPILTT